MFTLILSYIDLFILVHFLKRQMSAINNYFDWRYCAINIYTIVNSYVILLHRFIFFFYLKSKLVSISSDQQIIFIGFSWLHFQIIKMDSNFTSEMSKWIAPYFAVFTCHLASQLGLVHVHRLVNKVLEITNF